MAPDGPLWYFAYGSNLDPGTFLGRRKMKPLAARPGCAHGHRLVFDLPVGRGGRAVANLLPDPLAATWGVAYRIARAQADWLDRTEGVPAGVYRRVPVEVTTDDGSLEAFSYSSARGIPGRKPSRRYIGMLLAGARHHGLPLDWIDYLASLELAVDERRPSLLVQQCQHVS